MKKINDSQEFKKIKNGDSIYKYASTWLIYKTDIINKKSIWNKIQNIFKIIQSNNEFNALTAEQIDKFFFKRPEIDFEINFFSDLMSKCLVFKYKNKICCYTYSLLKRKNGRKIFVRFYFDYEKFINEFEINY